MSKYSYQKLVRPGDHMVLLYRNEKEVIEPLTEYIVESLLRNEKCLYISGDTEIQMLIKSIEEQIDLDQYISSGQFLMLEKTEAYSKNGEFAPDKMIGLLRELTEEALKSGYTGMSITGELSWVLNYEDGMERIIEYEWKLNDQIFNQVNLSALCRYNMTKFSDEMIINVIQLHPYIVYKNRIHENPFYLPTESYKENKIAKYQVQVWLKNIANYTKIKSKFDQELEESDYKSKAKSEFMSRMSHDMRTPLGAIIGLANFGCDEFKDEKAGKYYTEIKESAEYLLALMSDILDMQNIESGNINLDYNICRVCDLKKNILTIVKQRAVEKGLNIIKDKNKNEINPYVWMDQIRVKQILVNIINNAIKYTLPGGTVKWETIITQPEEGKVVATHLIHDTGLGMSEEFQKNMFEPFSKEANPLSKAEGGTGLGLAISRSLLKKMGGTIMCKSKLGEGTTFEIIIPYNTPTKEEIRKYEKIKNVQKNEIKLEGKKVLLCEDVEINIRIARKILEEKGMIVDCAENGEIAVEKAKNEQFDVILMDIRMPRMDGFEATKKIRQFDKEIPIIALSANAYLEDLQKSLEVGMNAHLTKPISKEKLYETLLQLI